MLNIYNDAQALQWSQIIKSFPDHDINYLPQYTRAFALHGDGEPQLFYYEGQGLRAANVVMRRDIAGEPSLAGKIESQRYFDLATPYGYGGWIFDGDLTAAGLEELDQVYQDYCQAENIISEFVRFHPLLGSETACAKMYEIVSHGPLICMDLSDPDTIWENIDRKKRNIIRKALKENVTVQFGLNAEILEQFKDIYHETMEHKQAEEYYFFSDIFYHSILTDLKDNALIFYALQGETVIAATIVIMAGTKMNYHLSGSRVAYRSCDPGSLLLYHTALWGCENGYKTLLLGGGLGSAEDSLLRFKKGFNKKSDYIFKTGRKIFVPQVYAQLCELRQASGDFEENSSFFPRYRL